MNIKSQKESSPNTPNIKPTRSKILSDNRRRNIGGGSILLLTFFTGVNLVGLVVVSLWFFNTSGNQQEAGQGFIERISILDEDFSSKIRQNNDSVKSAESDIAFLDKEVRKLWDLTNKKNKKNIENLSIQITELELNINEAKKIINTLGAKQRALNLEFSKLDRFQSNLKEEIDNIRKLEMSKSSLEERLVIQEEAMLTLDIYRKQINKSLLALQKKINALELELSN